MEPLDSPTFCPLLFNGLYIDTNGRTKSCCVQKEHYGDLRIEKIDEVMNNELHTAIKHDSLNGVQNKNCEYCWKIESNSNTYEFSNRVQALKHYETWMNNIGSFKVEVLDLRWQNTCNFACIMCSPIYSSKWEKERKVTRRLLFEVTPEIYQYINDSMPDIKEVYLAGGEPLQMKENVKILKQLLEINPTVSIRLNTNLSVIDTEVYRLLKEFPQENVQWNVSIDGELSMFEYVRWPGKWQDVYHNLINLTHQYNNVYCDILVNILNCENVLDLVEHVLLGDCDINPEHIKFTPLTYPTELDVRNYPDDVLANIMKKTGDFMVPHGQGTNYRSVMFMSALGLLTHMNDKDFAKDLDKTRAFLLKLDKQRNLDYKTLGTYLND